MKILKLGKEKKELLIIAVLIPEDVEKNPIGKLVVCANCELEGRLVVNEMYFTHDNGQDETIYIKCPNCNKAIKAEIIVSRLKIRNQLVA